MPKPKHEQEEKEEFSLPIYPKEELTALNELFDKKYNGLKTVADLNQWYIDEGALTKDLAVIVTGFDYKKNRVGEMYPTCDTPCKYLLLQDKLLQANKLRGRQEYAIKKELEAVEELAQGMKVQ